MDRSLVRRRLLDTSSLSDDEFEGVGLTGFGASCLIKETCLMVASSEEVANAIAECRARARGRRHPASWIQPRG